MAPNQVAQTAPPAQPTVAAPAPAAATAPKRLSLPISLSSPVDVGRLLRELEAVENWLSQARIRTPGSEVKMPKTSRTMDDFTTLNGLNFLNPADRTLAANYLRQIKASAPILHVSFSADPSALFVQKFMIYLRKQIHPEALMTIGLQPTIGAGCLIRSTNKYFDFSLRQTLEKKRSLLLAKLQEVSK